jgi:hypothetical protein
MIIGEENIDLIKIFRFLITSSPTPPKNIQFGE